MSAAAAPVRIVVADDHQIVRSGFAGLLDTQPDFTVVGIAADGAEAVRVCRGTSPDVVLMDVRMPGVDGIEATRQLTGSSSGNDRPRILILTTFDLDDYVYDALRAGASGFLLKDVTAEQLFHAVRVIAAGESSLAPANRASALSGHGHNELQAWLGHIRSMALIAQSFPVRTIRRCAWYGPYLAR